MHCHLLIPGLHPSILPGACDPAQGLRLPGLETLLARGSQTPCANGGWMDWLCREFGLEKQHDWPVAALTLLAEGGSPANDFWLRADPAHLQLQRDRMILMDAGGLAITNDEAAGLTATLNRHFADDGLIFSPTRPDRWHIRLSSPPQIETCPLEAVIGKDIRGFLPGGPDGKFWHRTLNEIQMLLHDHPINVAREQRGELAVNSIWPWGGGKLPGEATSPYAKIWAEDPLPIGLAVASGIPHAKPADTATEWLLHAAPGSHLIFLDSLRNAALHGDFLHWRENLSKLETDWFNPLRHALSRGRLSRLSLTVFECGRTRTFSVAPTDLWQFWRRRKPFAISSGASST